MLFAFLWAAPAFGTTDAAPADVPGLGLAERVEGELQRRPDPFANDPGHQSLVFPVPQPELLAFMRQIRVFGDPGALVLDTAHGFESHGAGLLDLLFATWRPEGRVPQLSDTFWFETNRARLPLAALYASHRNQIFLPVPGVAPGDIDGALPEKPQLARMLFRVPAMTPVEADAYHFLALLNAHEPDRNATWKNALGQQLSVALLLDNTRDYYLSSSDTPAEPADHSNLHLVDVLLDASRRQGQGPDAIKKHFLAVELKRDRFEAADETLLLAHYTESLGLLLADPRTRWSAEERAQVRAWLGRLDARFVSLEAEESRRLSHLLRGLRLVREHADRLR
jgi:hypothetical protein